jgi:RNA polymerase sigma factor (sigma-70 family)
VEKLRTPNRGAPLWWTETTTPFGEGEIMAGASPSLLRHVHQLVASHPLDRLTDRQLLEGFAAKRDEAAFTQLVRRHGPMVLGLCRRLLGHEQDAEDSFQAAFLILARKAGSIRQTDVGGFLYRVAYRLAIRARAYAAKRRQRDQRGGDMPAAAPLMDVTWREVRPVVDEELQRLPDELRSAVVLCYLEGKTHEEAARLLGWSKGTLRRRLDQGRERLRRRLLARGLAPMAALTATLFAEGTAPATVSATLVGAAVRIASGAAGSPAVAALAEGGLECVCIGKTKVAAAIVLTVSMLTGAGLWAYRGAAASAVAPPQVAAKEKADRPNPRSPQEEKRPTVEVGGQVLDPDGKPVRGAKLLFLWWGAKLPHKVWATSNSEGRFRFAAPQAQTANAGWEMPRSEVFIVAAAEGYGFAVARLNKPEAAANVTLRLVKDDVPIRGRVLDLEGRPVAGVRVRINDLEPLNQAQVYVPKKGDLTDWLAALKTSKKDVWRVEEDYLTGLYSPDFDVLFPPVTTGEDGRFQLRGIGRERLVHLRLEGPTIATQIVNVRTRLGEKIRLPLTWRHAKGEHITYHGAAFEVLAEPTKPVVGVVRDKDTGKPLAGVTIMPNKITNPWNISNYHQWLIRTTTDKDGRYRLVGLPKGEDNQLLATTDDLPYLPVSRKVENTAGLDPVTVDFALKRGVWVKGRVTEKTTGKPLSGGIGYFGYADNPHAKEIPSVFGGSLGGSTRPDGSFRFVVVPGRGLLAVQVSYNAHYLLGVGVEKIKVPRGRMGGENGIEYLETYPYPCQFPNYNTLAEIDPKPGDEAITCDLTVIPGRALKGTVLAPDGQPLTGARFWGVPLSGADFTVRGLPPNKLRKPWVLEFVHEGKKLAGSLAVWGDEKGHLRVRLQPWGAVTGRFVTPQGEPLTGMHVSCQAGDGYSDKQGRLRIEGLIPGRKYNLYFSKEGRLLQIIGGEPKDLAVKAGETKDLGDVKVKVKE